MKERPINFNSEMVRAILDGRKTQTRRLRGLNKFHKTRPDIVLKRDKEGEWERFFDCPYGIPGDRLWVRETWATPGNYDDIKPSDLSLTSMSLSSIVYRATEPYGDAYFKWRPSIHMPRWASRITLEITEVRVERLQEITLNDINAEGTPYTLDKTKRPVGSRREQFIKFWDSTNAKRDFPWDKNPWVWVISFERT